jgi:NADPH-dependent ferric siderophore reductase
MPRTPIRKEPPSFREGVVVSNEQITPRLTRIRLAGPELAALSIDEPAASVRLLVPTPGDDTLIIPTWNGNEFLRPDGSRPIIRTLTPRHLEGDTITLEIVLHTDGAMSAWAAEAQGGEHAAISGTGRGYGIDPTASGFLLAGDESAMPAISQLLEWIPSEADIRVIVELAASDARAPLPSHPRATVDWVALPAGAPPGIGLVDAVESFEIPDGWRVWGAGEAAAMFRIRKHLFDTLGLERKHATVRGYWKHGRIGPGV